MVQNKNSNKQDLRVWKLLKDKNDYLFFHRITKMLSAEKVFYCHIVSLRISTSLSYKIRRNLNLSTV